MVLIYHSTVALTTLQPDKEFFFQRPIAVESCRMCPRNALFFSVGYHEAVISDLYLHAFQSLLLTVFEKLVFKKLMKGKLCFVSVDKRHKCRRFWRNLYDFTNQSK